MCRSGGVANITRAVEWNNAPICRSERVKRVEESSQVASFILCWFIIPRSGFLHAACAMVGMTQWGAFLRIRPLFLECFRPYRCIISQGCALPASPGGKLLYRDCGCGGCRERFRPFGGGTAHRPFPTVSLVGGCFQPRDTKDGSFSVRGYERLRFYGFSCCCPNVSRCPALVFLSAVYYNSHQREGISGQAIPCASQVKSGFPNNFSLKP